MPFSRVCSHVWTPGIQPCHIANLVSHLSIQVDQKPDRSALFARNGLCQEKPGGEDRRVDAAIGFEILSQLRANIERDSLRLLVPERNRTD